MSTGLPYLPPENGSFVAGRNGGDQLHDDPAAYYPHYSTRTPDYASFGANTPVNAPSPSQTFHGVSVDPHLAHNTHGKRDMYFSPEDYTQGRYTPFPHSTPPHGLTRLQTDHFDNPSRQVFAPGVVSATSSSSSQSPERVSERSPSTAGGPAPISPTYAVRPRSDKTRIQLAPDQPLTTQGKPRTRVYVACIQCRGRKIRCDGAKPICHNCSRRSDNTGQCSYDAAPKRRGPDKTPGARQRMSNPDGERTRKGSRRREVDARSNESQSGVSSPDSAGAAVSSGRKPTPYTALFSNRPLSPRHDPITIIHESGAFVSRPSGIHSPVSEEEVRNVNSPYRATHEQPHMGGEAQLQQQDPAAGFAGMLNPHGYNIPTSPSNYPSQIPDTSFTQSQTDYDEHSQTKPSIPSEPPLQFARDTWWDALVSLYSAPDYEHPLTITQLTPGLREVASQRITSDLYLLFRHSPYWFSFINVPRFFQRFSTPHEVQPSLILAALAIATFFQSSENEHGARGRQRALHLRDQAQGALDASLNGNWVNEGLVQASWLLAFFEICAHPLHSTERVRSSMKVLDGLVRTLSLTTLDRGDPRVPAFRPRAVPAVRQTPLDPALPPRSAQHPREKKCSCSSLTLARNWAAANDLTPLWNSTPAWPNDWPEGELRKEECRRLVWSSVVLAAGSSSYTSASEDIPTLSLHIMDPSHYALLFPGEVLVSSAELSDSPKNSIWALYMRTMLLWHSCVLTRQDPSFGEEEKARFAVDTWLEIEAVEEALGRHSCGIERAFMFQGREYLFNTRMCTSYELQRFAPETSANVNLVVYRQKAEEWLNHQASVAKRLMQGLSTITGQPTSDLAKRPFYLFWLMSQISRTLQLWLCDNSLSRALEVSKDLCAPIEYLMNLWPCPEQRRRYKALRDRLAMTCYNANVPPPPPMTIPLA